MKQVKVSEPTPISASEQHSYGDLLIFLGIGAFTGKCGN